MVGVADYENDWAIAEASVSSMDPCNHETGHSFNLASKPPDILGGQRPEADSVKAPNGRLPLMRAVGPSTRWIDKKIGRLPTPQRTISAMVIESVSLKSHENYSNLFLYFFNRSFVRRGRARTIHFSSFRQG